jgi:hypothetical protein
LKEESKKPGKEKGKFLAMLEWYFDSHILSLAKRVQANLSEIL